MICADKDQVKVDAETCKLANDKIINGWGARIRTWECGDQNPVPYRLATPQ